MNPEQFDRHLRAKQEALKAYVNYYFPVRAGNIALRFINGNFRAQGWQGESFDRWKANKRKGTILVKTGRGRRGTQYTTQPGQVKLFNTVGYMAVHNRGFQGNVWIPAHTRRLIGKKQIATGRLTRSGKPRKTSVSFVKGTSTVKAHYRKMNIPKRKWAPESATDSPVLHSALRREIETEIKKIFS